RPELPPNLIRGGSGRAPSSLRRRREPAPRLAARPARALTAERDDRSGGDEVIEDDELDDREGLRPVELRAERELAETLVAEMACELHAFPDRLLDLVRSLAAHPARDDELQLPVPLDQREVLLVLRDDLGEVRVRETFAQDQVGVEPLGLGEVAGPKRDDDVRLVPLRPDEGLRV